jgi:hypothetical protein
MATIFLKDDQITSKQYARLKFIEPLAENFAKIEISETRVTDVVMNEKSFSEFEFVGTFSIDYVAKKANKDRGHVAYLWGAAVWVENTVKDNEIKIYGEGDPDFVKDFPNVSESRTILGLS